MGPLAITGITAGVGALANLFGHKSNTLSEGEIQDIISKIPTYDDKTAKINLQRQIAGILKARQSQAQQKNMMLGINDPTSVYAYDSPVFNYEGQANANIDALKQQDEARIKNYEAQLRIQNKLAEKSEPTPFELATSGAIAGANVGGQIANLIKLGNNPASSTIDQNTQQQTTVPPSLSTTDNTSVLNENDLFGYDDYNNLARRYNLKYGLNKKSYNLW